MISTPQTSWTEYSLSFPVLTSGDYKLYFQGQSSEITVANIAIANIELIEPPSFIGDGGIAAYNNNFKLIVINGFLKVVDISGTIGQITTNFLTFYETLTMPSDGSSSIYFRYISSKIYGRLFASKATNQMFIDYYNVMSFRSCNVNGGATGYKSNIMTEV